MSRNTFMKQFLSAAIILLFIPALALSQQGGKSVKEIATAISNLKSAVDSRSDESIKQAEAEVLRMGKGAAPNLEKIFRDKSEDDVMRHKAMDLTAKLRDEKMTDAFLSIAKDKGEKWSNRSGALHYMANLLHELKKENKTIDKKYMRELQVLFDDANNQIQIRESALGIYAQIGQNDALPLLKAKLEDSNKSIVGDAVYGIAAIRTPEAEDLLFQEYLKKQGTEIEGLYVYLFGRWKIQKTVPYLIEALKVIKGNSDEASLKRKGYITALGEIGDKSAISILQEIANNSDIASRTSFNGRFDAEDAATALIKMGDYETIKTVIRKIEIEGREGKGNEKRLRSLYEAVTGQDYTY